VRLPVRKVIRATPIDRSDPLWTLYALELECGHKRRKRFGVEARGYPDVFRCASCRDNKPMDFDPKLYPHQ
jgi:hypothetical protein